MNFEGYEGLKEMNKGQMVDFFKDQLCPSRVRGNNRITTNTNTVKRIDIWNGQSFDYDLLATYSQTTIGTDMSLHRPVIGDNEYTWGELKKHPADLLRVMIYQHLKQQGVK